MRAPLSALFLSDGRPGHYTLSEGILAALGRLGPVTVVRVEVRRPRWMPARVLSLLVNRGASPAAILRRIYGLDPALLPQADVIVSAGGDTLAANIAAARLTGASNVFYGSLRRYLPEDFTLILTSYARHNGRPRHLVTQKPNKLDPESIPLPRGLTAAPVERPLSVGLLVGGDSGTARFSQSDWHRLAAFIVAEHAAHGTRWLISTSPRTPAAATDLLANLPAGETGPVAKLIDFRVAGPGTLNEVLASSDAIVVTSDSSSMLSEAIWVRRPVVAVSPEVAGLPADEEDYRRFLEAKGWMTNVPLAALTPASFQSALGAVTPMRDNPMQILAETLAERLPQLQRSRH